MITEYIDLFVTNKGYFTFNGYIYKTNIDYAHNRSAFVVALPGSVDIIFAFGSMIENLSPEKVKKAKTVCECHERFGKLVVGNTVVYKGDKQDKNRYSQIQNKYLPQLFKKIVSGFTAANENLYAELTERLDRRNSKAVVSQLNIKRYGETIRSEVLLGLMNVLEAAGRESVQLVKDKLKTKTGRLKKQTVEEAALGISFNVWDPQVQDWIESNTAKLVEGIGAQTQEAIKTVIDYKVQGGERISTAVKEIKPLIGLNHAQATAVVNYEQRLIQQGLSASKVATKVNSYTKRLHTLRAQTIARTESRAAVSAGQLMGYKQSYVTEVKFSASSGACPICDGFDGRIYPMSKASLNWQSIPREPGISTGQYGGFR